MAITKSILENFTLDSGTEVYVQSSGIGRDLTLSFDGKESSFNISLQKAEALELQAIINKVLEELKNV